MRGFFHIRGSIFGALYFKNAFYVIMFMLCQIFGRFREKYILMYDVICHKLQKNFQKYIVDPYCFLCHNCLCRVNFLGRFRQKYINL